MKDKKVEGTVDVGSSEKGANRTWFVVVFGNAEARSGERTERR